MSFAATAALTEFWAKCKAAFQAKLVSGTNIKTINNESLLGSGNISISGGGSIDFGAEWDDEAMRRAEDYGDFGAMYFGEDEAVTVGGALPLIYGGTGAYDAANARNNLGFGEVKTAAASSVSAATSSNVNLRSISLTKGVWLVCARAQFASNSTGRRAAKLSTTSGESGNVVSTISMTAINGSTTQISVARFFKITSSSQTVYLVGWHNAGSSITCYGEIEAVRIG